MFREALGAWAICAATFASGHVQAQTESASEETLLYDHAMRCGALHGFFAIANEDDKETEKLHDDLATRWLVLAMMRDGEDGDKANREFEPLLLRLVDKLNAMEDDQAEMNDFLETGASLCADLQAANQTEFDAVELK